MALNEITGQRLRLAIMYLADYCNAVKQERGFVNVGTEIRYINENFRLVPSQDVQMLVNDVQRYYEAITAQEVRSINRGNWYKFKAAPVTVAARELFGRLQSIGFVPRSS